MPERVTFTASDSVDIVGHFYPSDGDRFAILLHIRPATKESMAPFAKKLVAAGYSCLAYDQRGHGESTMGGALDYEKFTDDESRGKQLDLDAAWEWIAKKGAIESKTVLIGGSIGANLAIRFAAIHHGIPVVIALSPGLNYRGVATDNAIVLLDQNQRLILVASDDDPYGSFDSCESLHALAPNTTVFLKQHGLGHGTNMTDAKPELIDELISIL